MFGFLSLFLVPPLRLSDFDRRGGEGGGGGGGEDTKGAGMAFCPAYFSYILSLCFYTVIFLPINCSWRYYFTLPRQLEMLLHSLNHYTMIPTSVRLQHHDTSISSSIEKLQVRSPTLEKDSPVLPILRLLRVSPVLLRNPIIPTSVNLEHHDTFISSSTGKVMVRDLYSEKDTEVRLRFKILKFSPILLRNAMILASVRL